MWEVFDIIALIRFLKKKICRFTDKLKYKKIPQKYIQKHIVSLYRAIKDNDAKDAYNSFEILAIHFEVKYSDFEIFDTLFYDHVVDVKWDILSEKFLEILGKYKKLISNERAMSVGEMDVLEKDLTAILEQSRELNDGAECLSCGTKISVKENKCSKCGWSYS